MGLGIATGVKCAADTPVEITYLGTNGVNLPIGPARADRLVVAVCFSENDAGGAMSDCLFDGVAGTILLQPTLSDTVGMAAKFIPTGSTVTVGVSQFGAQVVHHYLITGVKNGLYGITTASSGGTTLSAAQGTPAAKCALIMLARSRVSSGSPSANATGGTTGMALDAGGNLGGGSSPAIWVASGYGDKSGSSVTGNCIGSVAFNSGYGALAAFY